MSTNTENNLNSPSSSSIKKSSWAIKTFAGLALVTNLACEELGINPKENTSKPNTTTIDNTPEIKSPSGNVSYSLSKKPQEVKRQGERIDANGQKHTYTENLYQLDENGDAYTIDINSESKIPLDTDISKFNKATFVIKMKSNSGELSQVVSTPATFSYTAKNDLNRDGVIQNNEKFIKINASSEFGTSDIVWSGVPGSPLANNGYPLINPDGTVRPDSDKIYGYVSLISKLKDPQITKTEIKFVDNQGNTVMLIPLSNQ